MKIASLMLILLALAGCGKTGAVDSPVDAAARRTCMTTIEGRASKPDSITYLDKEQAIGRTKANGQLDVSIKLSAKDEIGRASTLVANCVVSADGKTLVDIQTKEGR